MKAFLLEYRRSAGELLSIEEFPNLVDATHERLRREDLRTDKDIEIAAIMSTDLESLKRSHSRYFMGNSKVKQAS